MESAQTRQNRLATRLGRRLLVAIPLLALGSAAAAPRQAEHPGGAAQLDRASPADPSPPGFPGAAETVPPPTELAAVRERILELVEGGAIPSMAVAVARGGRVIWQEAFGHADRQTGMRATPATVYPLGSLSKSIFATGLLALADRGLLDLEAPVAVVLGEGWLANPFAGARHATVLDVLAMRAGVPHGWTSYADAEDVPRGFTARRRHFGSLLFSAFPPGEVFEYSNFSYGVGELLIEKTTGRGIAEYMREAVFERLGMSASSADTLPAAGTSPATPYGSSGQPLGIRHALPGGGLGYFSSAHDLLRFGLYHLGTPAPGSVAVMSDAARERMRTFENLPPNLFHLGWWGDPSAYVSNGSVGGANAHLKLIPPAGLVIVTLMNQTGSQADETADAIAAALVPGEAERWAAMRQEFMARHHRPYGPDQGFAGVWRGTVETARGPVPLRLEMADEVTLALDGGPPAVARGPTTSILGRLDASLEPDLVGAALEVPGLRQAELTLATHQEELVGYLSLISSDATQSSSRPLFVRLVRLP